MWKARYAPSEIGGWRFDYVFRNGTPDNQEPDNDGDGFTDDEERRAGTDPLEPVRFPERR